MQIRQQQISSSIALSLLLHRCTAKLCLLAHSYRNRFFRGRIKPVADNVMSSFVPHHIQSGHRQNASYHE